MERKIKNRISFQNWINENLLLKLNDIVFGRRIYEYFSFLQESQWWSNIEIIDYQNEKLRQLIDHAYSNVPYYLQLFQSKDLTPSDIQSIYDLEKIPILTKELVRENFPEKIVAKNISKRNLLIAGSSGSTGQPLQYYRTPDALSFIRAANLRGWYWMNFHLGDPYIKISTMPRNTVYKKLQDKFNRCLYLNSKSMSPEDVKHIVEIIRKSSTKFLRGYPSAIYILSLYMQKFEINNIYLDAINTTSEPLFPHMRTQIEKMFHCKIFDSYGAEGGPVISECETHDAYHISSEAAIVQFYRNNSIVTEGKAKMIFTDLTNYATPFIRYDVKDFAILSEKKCTCKRGLPVIERIEGRDTDILITPGGKFITFYFFAGYFEHLDSVDMFQLEQNELNDFTLKIVVNKNFHSELIKKMNIDILEVLGNDVNLKIEIVDEIPLTKSGKRRFFIRNQNIPLGL